MKVQNRNGYYIYIYIYIFQLDDQAKEKLMSMLIPPGSKF